MTAIAGILPSTQKNVLNRAMREQLKAKIGFRGPDGLTVFHNDDILLVHAHLGSGPKANTFDDNQQQVVVAGDIRIDNRSDLIRDLGLQKDTVQSDADLVRAAFLRWGPSCFAKLLGDFALIVWDVREQALYCCRDHLGVRPFYYQESSGTFAFASEEKMLPDFQHDTFSNAYIAAFLGNIPFNEPETAHPGIFRLMPGHWLRWQNGQTTINKYWELEIQPVDPADPAAEFEEIFSTAVADRMCAPDQLATLLSGGLDSSAITGVAERILAQQQNVSPLRTYSMVYEDNPLLDETSYINDVLATGHYLPKFLPMDHYQPLDGIENTLQTQGGPYNSPGLRRSRHMYETISNDGVDVVLNGHGGDEVVGYGTGRLWELANEKRWLTMLPLIKTHSKLSNSSSVADYLQLLERFGSDQLHTRAARLMLRTVLKIITPQTEQSVFSWDNYLAPAYAEEMNLLERSRKSLILTPQQRVSDQHFQLKGLVTPLTASTFETFDKTSAAAGVEVRYPFYDIRLVNFCLGLSSSEKLRRNETRSILRRAMKDIYPDSIAKRQDKTNFLPELAQGLVQHHGEILEQMTLDPHGLLTQYLDMDNLRTGINAFRLNPLETDGGEVMFFWRVALLFTWLSGVPVQNRSSV